MAIQDRLLQFRLHIAATAAGIAVISLLLHGPTLSTVFSFFWPLLLSTACFLTLVALLLRFSPPSSGDSSGSIAGEELMDYVAGHREDHPGELAETMERSPARNPSESTA
ncbi:MFS general substrate transporter domain-containing protein [Dioscorea alata]|uniref:MFS general substrate transporter domain-containing protein n=1 Tax=Dioscorea alata TaxID=55571 RepID=A0ACB7VGS3_DIOAL|nr:MFS general substrate transporter domain-containing protein [Dioscorea alata]